MIEPEQLDQSTLSTERNDSQILITWITIDFIIKTNKYWSEEFI